MDSQNAPLSSGYPTPHQQCSNIPTQNVARNEKLASIVAGGGLIAYGLVPKTKLKFVSLLAGASLVYRGMTGHCKVYEQLGIDTARAEKQPGVGDGRGQTVNAAVHINRDVQDLYDLWRNLPNLPAVLPHLESVTPLDDRRSRWVARGPLGQSLQWDAEITEDRPAQLIAWRSLPNANVDSEGEVRFKRASSDGGTVLEVSIKYDPPGGQAIAKLAETFGKGLQQEINEDLRRFKQLMETGETATADMHGAY